mmetsp:Transcript_73579/g.186549  ORF Transcript_73579/g.186549 Transcript_73579/m.186549 type:complete len:184 (-) Transcript_73579:148-699(-)
MAQVLRSLVLTAAFLALHANADGIGPECAGSEGAACVRRGLAEDGAASAASLLQHGGEARRAGAMTTWQADDDATAARTAKHEADGPSVEDPKGVGGSLASKVDDLSDRVTALESARSASPFETTGGFWCMASYCANGSVCCKTAAYGICGCEGSSCCVSPSGVIALCAPGSNCSEGGTCYAR